MLCHTPSLSRKTLIHDAAWMQMPRRLMILGGQERQQLSAFDENPHCAREIHLFRSKYHTSLTFTIFSINLHKHAVSAIGR